MYLHRRHLHCRCVRGLLLFAACNNLRVETGDLVRTFMQTDTSCEMFARPPKSQEKEGSGEFMER